MGRRKDEREAAKVVLEAEDQFEHALKLFVAHCGGDVSKVTTGQREQFDEALADVAAHVAKLALEAGDEA